MIWSNKVKLKMTKYNKKRNRKRRNHIKRKKEILQVTQIEKIYELKLCN